LRVLSLFAGIGGFDLGLERTGGFKTVAFCEIDKKAQAVLRKHWPEVPIYDDVRSLTAEQLEADGIAVDVIVGGFPCQDISNAGKGAGLGGPRSGLWYEYARLIGELRPGFVIVENVSALLHRGLDAVLGSLAALGYDADWDCIPAAFVGAPHIRDRLWIVAYPQRSDANGFGPYRAAQYDWRPQRWDEQSRQSRQMGQVLPDADSERLEGCGLSEVRAGSSADAERRGENDERAAVRSGFWWAVEPAVGRVAHGVPGRVDRLKQLGNAVVPQIPELIGRAILASLAEQKEAA
jgi:DNA (cytosine-5)-methyltransferase 1